MKKYYLASPFANINHGITNYVISAQKVLLNAGVDVEIIAPDGPFRRRQFEEKILSLVSGGIVELPDTQGLFSRGCDQFELHVRLHAPILKLESLNQKKLSLERFERESALIANSKYVSSPTAANIDEYGKYGVEGCGGFLVFPNPLDFSGIPARRERDIDVVFVGRYERLKGIDYLRQVLMHYPDGVRVAIIGVKDEYRQYFSQDKFRCVIDFVGWSDNDVKYDYLSRSKVCIMLSRFESYSMVVAEGIACGCNVLAWNVGGAPEAFYGAPVKFIEPFDVRLMAAASLQAIELDAPKEDVVEAFVAKNNDRFAYGVKSIIVGDLEALKRSVVTIERAHSVFPTREAMSAATTQFVEFQSKRTLKLVGVSMNSESAENMWGCLLGTVFADYKLYSRHPLGTYYKKGFDCKFEIDPERYEVIDWFKHTPDVAKAVSEQSADVLFLFNGNTKKYRELVSRIYDNSHLNPVYSELGWLPQANHVYFDTRGANGHSSIRWAKLEALCGVVQEKIYETSFRFNAALLTLQLPGDTTLQRDSFPRAMSNQELIAYVRLQIPESIKLIVRRHPMDRTEYTIDEMENTTFDKTEAFAQTVCNVDVVIGVNSTILLEAMNYPVNIYAFGFGVFSGKGVLVECPDSELSEKWIDCIRFDASRRSALLAYLSERQINVAQFDQRPVTQWSEALYPIYLSMVVAESERDLGVRSGRPRGYISVAEAKKQQSNTQNQLSNRRSTKEAVRILSLERKLARLDARVELLEVHRSLFLSVMYSLPKALVGIIRELSRNDAFGSRADIFLRKLRKLFKDPHKFFVDFVMKHRSPR